jgi:hypothetical protein
LTESPIRPGAKWLAEKVTPVIEKAVCISIVLKFELFLVSWLPQSLRAPLFKCQPVGAPFDSGQATTKPAWPISFVNVFPSPRSIPKKAKGAVLACINIPFLEFSPKSRAA